MSAVAAKLDDKEWIVRGLARRALAQKSFIDYIPAVLPWMVIEEAHILIAAYLEAVALGKIDRLMIFMPPRSGKTSIGSVLFPSWYLGPRPSDKVLVATYKDELSTDFGREIRNVIRGDEYQSIFPGVGLAPDQQAAGRWRIRHPDHVQEGQFYGVGIHGGIAGRGFHLGVIDDVLSEQDAGRKNAKDFAYNWYHSGFYTRRQPEHSAIVIFTTRWAKDDLCGRLLDDARRDPKKDQWTVLSLPALIETKRDAARLNKLREHPMLHSVLRRKDGSHYDYAPGHSTLPRRVPTKVYARTKSTLGSKDWESLYQQRPVEEEGHIFMRKYWRRWPKADPPTLSYVMQVYDTAFSEKEEEDRCYSARTTWGVFLHNDSDIGERHHCILLEAMQGRFGFPELRTRAWASYKVRKPDRVLIEKKASGKSLIQELRRRGLPVAAVPADRDKVSRAHAASVVLEQGCVWYLPTLIDEGKDEYQLSADTVINQGADFPFAEFDDITDTVSHAWIYLRRLFWLNLADEKDEDDDQHPRLAAAGGKFRGYGN